MLLKYIMLLRYIFFPALYRTFIPHCMPSLCSDISVHMISVVASDIIIILYLKVTEYYHSHNEQ